MRAQGILETAIYAEDLGAAEAFYGQVFGLDLVRRLEGQFAFFRCGEGMLLVFDPRATSRADPRNPIPRHGASGPGHVCFRAEDATELALWERHFKSHGVAIELDHVWPSGGRSLYLRDPAGNSVEIAEPLIWGDVFAVGAESL